MNSFQNQIDLSDDFRKGVVVDLHCHSSYAGGTGSLDLRTAVDNMPKKGVKLVGTGDCLFEPWLKTLKEQLVDPEESGVYELKDANEHDKATQFVLQTELAFTAPVGVNRKNVHGVFLFPNFDTRRFQNALPDRDGPHR